MAKIKGNGNPLSHQDMDANFTEINTINERVTALEASGVGGAGPAGPQGPQGPQGDKGDKGDPGSSVDLSNYYTKDIVDVLHTVNMERIEVLEARVTALQAELDTNQQSAENILNGIIARINIARGQTVTARNLLIQERNNIGSTGDPQIDQILIPLVREFYNTMIAASDTAIEEYDSQLTLLNEDFTI